MFSNPTRFCGFRHRDGHAADLWVLAEVALQFLACRGCPSRGPHCGPKGGRRLVRNSRSSWQLLTRNPRPAGAMSPWFFRLSVRSSLASSGRTCSTPAAPRTTLSGIDHLAVVLWLPALFMLALCADKSPGESSGCAREHGPPRLLPASSPPSCCSSRASASRATKTTFGYC
jgi:hypothetical protein